MVAEPAGSSATWRKTNKSRRWFGNISLITSFTSRPTRLRDQYALFENHEAIAAGTLAILDAVDRLAPKAKVLLAGSGLQFINQGLPLNEGSPLYDSSPYVVARNSSLFAARYFRQRGLKIYFAYLFNHDSPLRSNRHLNMKIAMAAARVANGSKEKLLIGDLDAEKEFNFAGDVAAAMWLLIRQDELFECVLDLVKPMLSGIGSKHAFMR